MNIKTQVRIMWYQTSAQDGNKQWNVYIELDLKKS